MKKRKTYEVSVIDKTYSKVIADETKFYTSDTALELGFELKETEYNFESAEIVLLNIDDRSLVTRPINKNSDSFTYELDEDITAHYGDWRGQLRFEQAGEIYVSSRFEFRIEDDLGNDRPPQLSDVQSWVSLKRYADKLTDELKQAVMSVEGIEGTFNENELERQTTFETAEQSRQTTFEANESERDETFNNNEDIRQSQELEREKAESQRQTVFDGNEANRTEAFNTNEATRQENETTRQQAELIRVENENQRKIDHANRSAEFEGKADKVVIKNLIENGDFSDGLSGLRIFGGQSTIDTTNSVFGNQSLKVTATEEGWTTRGFYKNATVGDVYYISGYIFTSTGVPDGSRGLKVEEVINDLSNYGGTMIARFRDAIEKWAFGSILYTPSSENLIVGIKVFITAEVNYNIDSFQFINLTQIFGTGNEPTKEEMDELIKVTGYIDGEYALNNKEMLIWTLALIRSNKNAIISLGGTI